MNEANNFYNNKKRAVLMLKQHLAAKPRTVEDLHRLVLNEFGFGLKFVMTFLDLHKDAIKQKNGFYEWKA